MSCSAILIRHIAALSVVAASVVLLGCPAPTSQQSWVVVNGSAYAIEAPEIGSTVHLVGVAGSSEWVETEDGGQFTVLVFEELDGIILGHEYYVGYTGNRPRSLPESGGAMGAGYLRVEVDATVEDTGLELERIVVLPSAEVPRSYVMWPEPSGVAIGLGESDLLSERPGAQADSSELEAAWLVLDDDGDESEVVGRLGRTTGSTDRDEVSFGVVLEGHVGSVRCGHTVPIRFTEDQTVFEDASSGQVTQWSLERFASAYRGEGVRVLFRWRGDTLVADRMDLVGEGE